MGRPGPYFLGVNMLTNVNTLVGKNFGIDFHIVVSNLRVIFVAYAFADDTDLIETAKYKWETIDHVVYQMQEALETWEGLI